MNLTEAVSVLGAPAAVLLFMWLNRNPQKDAKPDGLAAKLDAVLDETKKANTAMADLAKSMAVLMDRSER